MNPLAIGLDLVALVFAAGLCFYAQFLRSTFKGGVLEGPFKILIVSGMLFVGAAAYEILGELGVLSQDVANVMHSSFESLFLLTLFWGFYRIASVWRASVSNEAKMAAVKPMIREAEAAKN